MMKTENDIYYMTLALIEAYEAYKIGEVPVGAVLVNPEGFIIASSHNMKETLHDPTAHAEVIAIREAAIQSNDWRLTGHTLYVTKEPCVMCAGAILNSRISRVVYGCRDSKGGAVDSLYGLLSDERLNHRAVCSDGILGVRSSRLLKEFFVSRRGGRAAEGGGLENRCGG